LLQFRSEFGLKIGSFYNLYSFELFHEIVLISNDPLIKYKRKVFIKAVILLLYILIVIKLSVNNFRYIVGKPFRVRIKVKLYKVKLNFKPGKVKLINKLLRLILDHLT
jgi:hypothetical protein